MNVILWIIPSYYIILMNGWLMRQLFGFKRRQMFTSHPIDTFYVGEFFFSS